LATDSASLSPLVLRAANLGREIPERRILDDITFDVRQGDVLAVVGPSGAGKSSLLRLLNRLDEPTDGTFWVEGKDFREFAPRQLRRRVGMVMQTAYLFPGTVADNLRFGPRQAGREMADEEVDRLLTEVGLPGFGKRTTANLSGGEAQRVSLARSLANQPVVLLLDEPTSALDEEAKRGIEVLISDIARQKGLTCVIVTHDMAQAARMANRTMLLESGRLKRIGPTEEVLNASRT
jgi:putative ABC transport system ATP-binding protein